MGKAHTFVKPEALIVNQAADAIVEYLKLATPLGKGATREMAEAALRGLVDQYEGTRVSHVFWNACYQRAAYRSDVWASYWDVPKPETDVVSWPRRYYELHKLGIDDAFALLVARSREKGISPWISLRMNDMHYHEDPNRMNPLWNDNPQLWNHPKAGFHNGFDFTQPQVRGHYMALIEEVLSRWDSDGVELDWMRFPHHFRNGELEAGRAALTAFMRDVRGKADAAAKRLGHPVGVAVRVPATAEFADGLGMDAVAWAREGLIDVLIPGSLWRPSFPDVPVEAWRGKVGKECAIVPGTDLWIGGMRGGVVAASGMAPIRAFTASMLDRGADAIYLFNHFSRTDSTLASLTIEDGADRGRTMGDLLTTAGSIAQAVAGPRRHILTFHDPLPPNSGYHPPLPATVAVGTPARLKLHIGPAPAGGSSSLRVGLADSVGFGEAALTATVNGVACRGLEDAPAPAEGKPAGHGGYLCPDAVAPRLLRFGVPIAALQRGYNEIGLTLPQGTPQRVVWLELRVDPQ